MGGPNPSVGLYGKHPSFGDFVTAGLPEDVQNALEKWVHKLLPALRDMNEGTWQTRFDEAPEIRVWFGADLVPGGFCGVIRPAVDKVGRRFPMIAGVTNSGQMSPMLDSSAALYDAIGGALDSFKRGSGDGAREFSAHLLNLTAPFIAVREDSTPDFWAARPDGDLGRLAGDIAYADHDRAAVGRSYMWVHGPGGLAIHAAEKLQSADVVNWLMTDAVLAPSSELEPVKGIIDNDPADTPQPTH
ncbi:type VI secretion system-associated protein TagF [Yoonia sp.]|uniref:type VI secretion system-associated protein TagF n=1 Tax=Yoonia sp. TaxID=2212373 RepID=UPI002385384B|nr:type VI secretion system-associated protein TagF [Yoonia sp.]MDE0851044.1 type VI secretion system-associated protein TagF [Yoonia sp.]